MSSELVATYSALGTKEGDEYFRGPECLACVKDLIRALRHDDDHCGVRRSLGKAQVLQTDLIPLLVHFNNDIPLRNDIIRLLVNLTQPCVLCFPDTLSHKETVTSKCILEVSQYLRQYKEEFAVERVMNVLGNVLGELCQKDWEDRDDDDIIIIERILLLIRNVLHVPSEPTEEKRTDDDVSTHDRIIWNIHVNGIDELLLFLGSNPSETQWCMHVLEIIFFMLREQSPLNLVRAGESRSISERKEDEDKMDELLAKERQHKQRSKYLRGSRHSNFGGSYTVTNQKMSSGNERVYLRTLAGFNEHSYDIEKRPRRTHHAKRRLAVSSQSRLSTYSIRLILKEFCIQVLDYCFNVLMRVVKDTIKRHQSMDNDETYYLWTMKFFMEFSRFHNFRVDIVSESLQLSTVHQVLQLIANYYEHVFMNKRDRPRAIEWGQRLQYSVQAYKELLLHVQEMTRSKDDTVVKSSKIILSNLLYHSEYRDVFVMLLRNYNEAFFPLTFLHDVIQMTHTYLQLVDVYSKQNGCLVIQKKRKSQSSKRKETRMTEEQMLEIWNEVENEAQLLLTDGFEMADTHFPFDVTSDVPMEEQKLVVMKQIHQNISQKNLVSGLSLMKAARETWPDDVFGSDAMTPDEEITILHDLFMNPLSIDNDNNIVNEEEEIPHEEEIVKTFELELDLKKFTFTFANNKIVRVYSLVLENYRTNSDELNHAVVKMLYTIAIKHEMTPMLFQISLFRIFSKILDEPPLRRYQELQKFCCRIVANFFRLAQDNSLMFAELLIWKTSGDCYELKEGYGALQQRREQQKNKSVWTREQEEELARLYEQYKDENDIVGCILAALPGKHFRTRRIIASQLVSQGLVGQKKDLHKKKAKANKEPWSEEEIFTLQSLWQPSDDINEAIKQLTCYFPERGIRDIKQQLNNLGLIKSKSSSQKMGQEVTCDENSNSSRLLETSNNKRRTKRKKKNIDRLIELIHLNGYSEQLSWLTTYINDEANDRELDNEWEELCIVTVEQAVAEALKTELFCDLMNSLGLTPPSEQEMYWRIPSALSPSDLKALATSLTTRSIQDQHDQQVSSSDEENDETPNNGAVNSDYEEESFTASEALAILRQKRKSSNIQQQQSKKNKHSEDEQLDSRPQEGEGGGPDNDDHTMETVSNQCRPSRKRSALFDSDDDDETTPFDNSINEPVDKEHEIARPLKRNALFDSDDEHETTPFDNNISEPVDKEHETARPLKRNALFDSDDEHETTPFDNSISEPVDKEHETARPLKRNALFDSDDDDNVATTHSDNEKAESSNDSAFDNDESINHEKQKSSSETIYGKRPLTRNALFDSDDETLQ